MVCKPDVDEKDEAFCVVRDFSGTSHEAKVTLQVSSSMTGKEFVREVAKLFNFEPYSFRLVSPTLSKKNNHYEAVLTEESEDLLKVIGVNFETNNRNCFIVEGLNGGNPRLANKDDDLELGASASPEEPSSSTSYSPPLPPLMLFDDAMENNSFSFRFFPVNNSPLSYNLNSGSSNDKDVITNMRKSRSVYPSESPSTSSSSSYASIGYRGLVNQAMTCYLNSLLQALFMTPEFRNALYNWKFVSSPGVDESKSIPYQLQKLFLNLQTSPRIAVETTDLTRSFGWDSSEAWQQHDIQELCRVMFDALEQEFKGTEQADLINRLYQGKMIDYVKCLECGTEKSREDTFLDIPLPVRPFGCTTAYGSVEEALRAFVQPEVLDGNNQYFCERCNKKCNAHKGLKFAKFPYLLTLHLMRFDFDYNTMHRIKLSDKVIFPETLNLNSFISTSNTGLTSNYYKEEGSEGFPEEITGPSSKCDDGSTTDSGSAIDDESCMASSNDLNNVDYEQEVDEGIDVSNQHENEKNRNHSMEAGPYIYELFSIMVHSGSASGGHYYVYIKDFHTGDWFCFNDQTVTKITSEDIDRSFGGYGPSRGYYSGVYSSSMNAYMLMYRQIDPERNVLPLKEHEFPPHIKSLLKEMDEKAEFDRKMREKEKEIWKIKVYVLHPTLNRMIDARVDCNTNTPLKEVTQIAFKKLQLDSVVSLDLCRLVLYNRQLDMVDGSFEGKENEKIGSLLNPSFMTRKSEMLMEIRQPDVPFPTYRPGAVPVKLYVLDSESDTIQNPLTIRTSLTSPISIFREELYERFSCPRSYFLFLFLELQHGIEKFLEDESISLQTAGVTPNAKIFVLFKKTDCVAACRHKMRNGVRRFLNTLKLNILLPNINPEALKRLSIPTLTEFAENRKQNDEIRATSEKESCVVNNAADEQTSCLTNVALPSSLLLTTSQNNLAASAAPSVNAVNPNQTADDLCMQEVNNRIQCASVGSTISNGSKIGSGNTVGGGGQHSDQSASEDSSLTDSDRTIIGENQDDGILSSPSSSLIGCDIRYTNDLNEDDNFLDSCSKIVDYYKEDNIGDALCDDYFIEIRNNIGTDQNNVQRQILNIEVDKRMPMNTFKKYLEPYIQVPSLYFTLSTDRFIQVNIWSFDMNIESLKYIDDGETLHVRLNYPSKYGTTRHRVFLLDFNSNQVVRFVDKFDICEEGTVGEAKKELLQDLRILQNIDVPFERCRLRMKNNGGPGKILLNEQLWKDLNLGYEWELYLQVLESEEPIVDPERQTSVIVKRCLPVRNNGGRLREVVIQDRSVASLKAKISEISEIPVNNIVLGCQLWSSTFSSTSSCPVGTYNANVDVDWNTITDTMLHEWLLNLNEDSHIICFKYGDGENKNEKCGRVINVLESALTTQSRREKSLKIRVNNTKPVDDLDVEFVFH